MTKDWFLQQQLAHLVDLATRQPDQPALAHAEMKRYAWERAKTLAEKEPMFYRELPRLLREAMQSASKQPGQDRPSTKE